MFNNINGYNINQQQIDSNAGWLAQRMTDHFNAIMSSGSIAQAYVPILVNRWQQSIRDTVGWFAANRGLGSTDDGLIKSDVMQWVNNALAGIQQSMQPQSMFPQQTMMMQMPQQQYGNNNFQNFGSGRSNAYAPVFNSPTNQSSVASVYANSLDNNPAPVQQQQQPRQEINPLTMLNNGKNIGTSASANTIQNINSVQQAKYTKPIQNGGTKEYNGAYGSTIRSSEYTDQNGNPITVSKIVMKKGYAVDEFGINELAKIADTSLPFITQALINVAEPVNVPTELFIKIMDRIRNRFAQDELNHDSNIRDYGISLIQKELENETAGVARAFEQLYVKLFNDFSTAGALGITAERSNCKKNISAIIKVNSFDDIKSIIDGTYPNNIVKECNNEIVFLESIDEVILNVNKQFRNIEIADTATAHGRRACVDALRGSIISGTSFNEYAYLREGDEKEKLIKESMDAFLKTKTIVLCTKNFVRTNIWCSLLKPNDDVFVRKNITLAVELVDNNFEWMILTFSTREFPNMYKLVTKGIEMTYTMAIVDTTLRFNIV